MIIELNTAILDAVENINSNQLIFLSMILDKNQKSYQDVRKLISLISDDEISYLLEQNLITCTKNSDKISYKATEKLLKLVTPSKDYFDTFYDIYPVYVLRPDGSKSYLRINVNKCRNMYKSIVGNSSAYAEHINKCLKFEIDKKISTGKLGYMKNMWKWLVDRTWEESEQEMLDNTKNTQVGYGEEFI